MPVPSLKFRVPSPSHHFTDTARKIPGSHIIKRAKSREIHPVSSLVKRSGVSGPSAAAFVQPITITDKKHQGSNKNKRPGVGRHEEFWDQAKSAYFIKRCFVKWSSFELVSISLNQINWTIQ